MVNSDDMCLFTLFAVDSKHLRKRGSKRRPRSLESVYVDMLAAGTITILDVQLLGMVHSWRNGSRDAPFQLRPLTFGPRMEKLSLAQLLWLTSSDTKEAENLLRENLRKKDAVILLSARRERVVSERLCSALERIQAGERRLEVERAGFEERLAKVEREKSDVQGGLGAMIQRWLEACRQNRDLQELLSDNAQLTLARQRQLGSVEMDLRIARARLTERDEELARFRSRENLVPGLQADANAFAGVEMDLRIARARLAERDEELARFRSRENLVPGLQADANAFAGVEVDLRVARARLAERDEEELARFRSRENLVSSLQADANASAERQLAGVELDLCIANARLAERDEELARFRSRENLVPGLQADANASAAKLRDLTQLISTLTDKVRSLTGEKDQLHTDLCTAEDKCDTLSSKVVNFTETENKLLDIVTELGVIVQDSGLEWKDIKYKLENSLCTAGRSNVEVRLAQEISVLREELSAADRRTDELQVEVEESRRSKVEVEQDLRDARKEVDQLRSEGSVLYERAHASTADTSVNELDVLVSTLREENSNLVTDLSTAKDENATLHDKVEEGTETEKQLLNLLGSIGGIAENSAAELESTKAKLEEHVCKSRVTEDRLRMSNADLEAQLLAVREELSSANRKVEELSSANRKVEELQLEVAVHTDSDLSTQSASSLTENGDDEAINDAYEGSGVSSTRTSSAASSNDSG